jgi:AhpD family alkylhydroperoxidase
VLNKWKEVFANNRSAAAMLERSNPKVLSAFRELNAALGATGTLDAKTRELIAMAVAVTTRCDGCIASHAAAARRLGATEIELSEALGVAIALNAGAAYVYSLRALDAFSEAGT